MTLEEQLAQLRKEAGTLRDKALNKASTFTRADGERAEQLGKSISDTERRIAAKNSASAAIAGITGGDLQSSTSNDEPAGGPGQPFRATARKAAGATGGQHERAAAFAGVMRKALDQAAGTIGGPAVGKALVPQGAVAFGFDGRIIEDPKAEYSLPAAVNSRPIDTPNGSYLRQTLRENNAATVATGELKPVSRYALEPVPWKVATIAHLAEPIPVQHFEDYNALDRFLVAEMAYGLESAVSDFILRGGIAEDGSPVEGILTTPGVLQTAYAVSAMQSVRRALGDLEANGTTATGIVMNPTDWMDVELSTDADGRFLLGPNQPTAAPERRLWNRPVTLTNDMPAGQAVVGDLSTVTLLARSSALLAWNPFVGIAGTEEAPTTVGNFRRNLIEPRLEVRVALEVSSPKSLRVVDLVAPAPAV
ncbi:phage major capsid protein [Arthrobacter sp. Br18]|uniref:phage major capsid protein n=1 Tax=Arthrobacter sp. Br18 TaxID=1312954 RepID=UPI00047B4764|nr:phage major capsid protein [Arthrobacter sp. Br18]